MRYFICLLFLLSANAYAQNIDPSHRDLRLVPDKIFVPYEKFERISDPFLPKRELRIAQPVSLKGKDFPQPADALVLPASLDAHSNDTLIIRLGAPNGTDIIFRTGSIGYNLIDFLPPVDCFDDFDLPLPYCDFIVAYEDLDNDDVKEIILTVNNPDKRSKVSVRLKLQKDGKLTVF